MFTDGQFYVASFSPTGVLKPRVRCLDLNHHILKNISALSLEVQSLSLIGQVWSNPHSVPSEAGPHFDNFAAARYLDFTCLKSKTEPCSTIALLSSLLGVSIY
jgi:hypothetical protein